MGDEWTMDHMPERPDGTKIEVRREGEALTIYIPPAGLRGPGGGLLVFSILWNGFMAFFTPMWFLGEQPPGGHPVFLYLFLALFWAVGIGLLIGALKMIFGKTLVRIEGGGLFIQKKLFGRGKLRQHTLPAAPSARLETAYEQNDTPVYAVVVKADDGKVKFGTALSDDEKDWLVAELNVFFGAENVATPPSRAKEIKFEEYHVTEPRERPRQMSAEIDDVPGRELRIRFAPLRRTWFGGVLFALTVLVLLGSLAGVGWLVWRLMEGEEALSFFLTAFLGFAGPLLLMVAFLGLPQFLRRAEVTLTRDACTVHNTLQMGERAVRSVPIERVAEAVIKKAGPIHLLSLKLKDGAPMDVYGPARMDELEWMASRINECLAEERGL